MSSITEEKLIENTMRLVNLRTLIFVTDKACCTSQVKREARKAKKEYKRLSKSHMQDIKEFFGIDESTSPERLKETADILVKMIRGKQAEGTIQ